MTPPDLSPAMRRAYEALPEEEREAYLKECAQLHGSLIKACISQVMARNQSHNAGKHVLEAQ